VKSAEKEEPEQNLPYGRGEKKKKDSGTGKKKEKIGKYTDMY